MTTARTIKMKSIIIALKSIKTIIIARTVELKAHKKEQDKLQKPIHLLGTFPFTETPGITSIYATCFVIPSLI